MSRSATTREETRMRGRKNPPLDLTPPPNDAPPTFDTMAVAYLQDYQLQRYRSLTTARARVEHLRRVFGGRRAEMIGADDIREYQLARRKEGSEAATVNRETSALSRMFQLAIRRGQLQRMPLFPKRLEENPPRDGFFEHDESRPRFAYAQARHFHIDRTRVRHACDKGRVERPSLASATAALPVKPLLGSQYPCGQSAGWSPKGAIFRPCAREVSCGAC
jgi:hypothetical protein